ncbi:MFS transporter [Nocardioides soli]|uniref:EmrB/QacA subfamily drug resistance transporter n=1 Tax=Nocardioides soli TaxID=1036020 RepID=A0A7W4YZG1_9ACTN|nr:MFS transporter [Nocardioides soli]MBB3040922.1 EmrB/QacA subfamily drug resistance transporter [Nocardioides soli]
MSDTSTAPSPPQRRWLGLAVIAAAQFMVIMDTSIIGVALPQMQDDLGFSPEDLTWVFNAYVIAFGGLLLAGGKLADLYGARRVFTAGWVVLAAGSLVAGLAGNVAVELTGRALQGAGSALIAPAALTMLMMLFGREPRELTKALAVYGAAAPAGGTAGVFLGGVLTEYASWPWVFLVNLPIAAVILAVTPSLLPAGRAGSQVRVDVFGAVTVTGGLTAAVYGIVSAPEVGWSSWRTWAALGLAAVLLVAFVVRQARAAQPLVRLGIFAAPNLGAANLAQALLGAAWVPMWFFLNLYLQQVLGYSAFPSGAALLPMTALIMIGMALIAPRVITAIGPKRTTVAGLAILTVGLGWLSRVDPDGSFVVDVLPASLVAALGMALAFIPSLGTAITSAAPDEGGLASGIVNTSYQVGSALGLAVITAVAAAAGASAVADPAARTDGYSAAFLAAAVVALAGAVASAALLRPAPTAPAPGDASPTAASRV